MTAFVILGWCAFARGAWALLPVLSLLVVTCIGPPAIRRGVRAEYWGFGGGLAVLASFALAAAMTGGPRSPIAYLLPVGLAMGALRGTPRVTVLETIWTVGVFLVACLLRAPTSVLADPLMTAAPVVAVVSVAVCCAVLSGAEIAYRGASVLDPLTGLLNRNSLEDRFSELREQARLVDAPMSMVLFDLDHFKAINDRHGHETGDAILREVAYQVRKQLRMFELVYRMGGEEFLVLLPGLGAQEGARTAERLRDCISAIAVAGEVGVTASFGVSCGADDAIEFESLYRDADLALYRAKDEGRDRVAVTASGELRLAA